MSTGRFACANPWPRVWFDEAPIWISWPVRQHQRTTNSTKVRFQTIKIVNSKHKSKLPNWTTPPKKHLTGSTTGPTSIQSLGRTPPMSPRWLSSIVSNQGDVQIILLHNSFLQISNAYKRGKMRYWTPIQNGAVIKLTDCIFWARWPVCSDCIWTQFKIWWAPSKGFK